MIQSALKIDGNRNESCLYIAFELANSKWKLAFGDGVGERIKFRNIDAGDTAQLQEAIKWAQAFFGLPAEAPTYSCYEAGRDGFWLHRYLSGVGVGNSVVDSSSIEVPRRKRKAKTDKIDARKLLQMLIRYHRGERKIWSVVNVAPEQIEDLRRINRELDRMRKEQTAHTNRIGSLLVTLNIRDVVVNRHFMRRLDELTDWNDKPLAPHLKAELGREFARWQLVHQQILDLERERKALVAEDNSREMVMTRRLMQLRGIGMESAFLFSVEVFSWRDFKNRKQVGGFMGLCGVPFDSGDSSRDQGISKAGPRRLRAMANQISWLWMYHQPGSKQTKWFNARYANGGTRMRKVGIVAVSRRLMIELWHYLEHGVVPEGALMKTT